MSAVNNSERYWLERTNKNFDEKFKDREIKALYRKQYRDIEREILSLYEKAKEKGISTRTDLYKFDRFRTLLKTLKAQDKTIKESVDKTIFKELKAAYNKQFKDVLKGIKEKEGGFVSLKAQPDKNAAERVLKTKYDGFSFSERIWKGEGIANRVREDVITAVTQGTSTDTLTKNLMRDFDASYANSERIYRTELQRTLNTASRERFREAGIKRVKIISASDERRCKYCKDKSGKTVSTDAFLPPYHPNCRCTFAPVFEDTEEIKTSGDSKPLTGGANNGIIDNIKEFSEETLESFNANVGFEYDFEKDVKIPVLNAYNNGREIGKQAFKKYVPKDAIKTWDATRNYHIDGKVNFNALLSLSDERGIITAYFHEFGHLVDLKARGSATRLSMLSPKFGEALKNDVQRYIDDFIEKNGRFLYQTKISQKIFWDAPAEKQVFYSSVSDIFDGVTDGKIFGKYAHSHMNNFTYWKRYGALESEAFAHMFEAQFDKERYKLLKKYFPTALGEFEKLLEGAL